MKWFYENELPKITDIESLESAMGTVKARFNGHPHKFTRNDYLLFINTLYAALQNILNTSSGSTSAILSNDLTTNYSPEVGYVGPGTDYKKGDSLEKIITDILVGQRDKKKLPKPSINGNNFVNNEVIEITSDEEYADKSLIYYTTSNYPGWRIYDGEFTITEDTTIKAKLVPKYDYYRLYDESDISTETYYKSIPLTSPEIVGTSPFYNEETITITHANDEISCNIYYTIGNDGITKQYTGPFVINEPTRITAYVASSESKYIPSDEVSKLFQEKLHPYPNVEDHSFYPGESVVIYITPNPGYENIAKLHYIINGVDQECGEVLKIDKDCTVKMYYKANDPELYVDSEEISFNVSEIDPIQLEAPIVNIINHPIYSEFTIDILEVHRSLNARIYYEIDGDVQELTIDKLPYSGEIFENNTIVKVWAEQDSNPAYLDTSEIKEITSQFTELPPLTVVFDGDGVIQTESTAYSKNDSIHYYYNYPKLGYLEAVVDEYEVGNYQQVDYYINDELWDYQPIDFIDYDEPNIKFYYKVTNEGGIDIPSNIINITLSRQYLDLKEPVIEEDGPFDDEQLLVHIKNGQPEECAEYVQLYVEGNLMDGVEQVLPMLYNTEIIACVRVLDEYLAYYEAPGQKCVSKTFTKDEPIVIYSTMLDPVGRNPVTYSTTVGGRPQTKTFDTLSIGQEFALGTFDNVYKNDSVPERNDSGYFVKLQQDSNPLLYFNKQIFKEDLEIYVCDNTLSNWPKSGIDTSNYAPQLISKGEYSINDTIYYQYELNINNQGNILYNINYK